MCLLICSPAAEMLSQADGSVTSAEPCAAGGVTKPTLHTSDVLPQQSATAGPLKTSLRRTAVSVQPRRQSVADDGRRTIAKVPPPESDGEDEVEVIQAFCGRPTRSGRIPRPAVRPSQLNDELLTGFFEPLTSASDITENTQLNSSVAASSKSEPAVTMSEQSAAGLTTQSSQSSADNVQCSSDVSESLSSTSLSGGSVTASHIDPSNLPPGYFVVVDMPSSDAAGTQQQAMYHIFAVDPVTAESSMSTAAKPTTAHVHSQASVHSSSVLRRHQETLNSVDVSTARHTDSHAVVGVESSPGQEVTQICHDLSGLADCELTAMRQADGTLIIQTTPASRYLPLPRPPPALPIPRPASIQLVPRQRPVKLVPRLPSSILFNQRPSAQVVTHGQAYNREVVVDTHYSKSPAVTVGDTDSAHYVDIVVEDCDSFEREECVV